MSNSVIVEAAARWLPPRRARRPRGRGAAARRCHARQPHVGRPGRAARTGSSSESSVGIVENRGAMCAFRGGPPWRSRSRAGSSGTERVVNLTRRRSERDQRPRPISAASLREVAVAQHVALTAGGGGQGGGGAIPARCWRDRLRAPVVPRRAMQKEARRVCERHKGAHVGAFEAALDALAPALGRSSPCVRRHRGGRSSRAAFAKELNPIRDRRRRRAAT